MGAGAVRADVAVLVVWLAAVPVPVVVPAVRQNVPAPVMPPALLPVEAAPDARRGQGADEGR